MLANTTTVVTQLRSTQILGATRLTLTSDGIGATCQRALLVVTIINDCRLSRDNYWGDFECRLIVQLHAMSS